MNEKAERRRPLACRKRNSNDVFSLLLLALARLRAIARRAGITEHALARRSAHRAVTRVFSGERRLSRAERGEHGVREIVAPVFALRIAARHFEVRGRLREDDTTDVDDLGAHGARP